MKNTIQQQLSEMIYELLPHKKELEFGCIIKSYCHPDIDIVTDDKSEIDSLVTGKYALHDKDNIEIIGQPIRLADILLAVKIKHNELFNAYETEDGNKEFSFSGDLIEILSMYNLEKDNILDQSDEFCESLLIKLK